MAGYSGTPLEQKLGVRPGLRIAVLGAPPGFELARASPFQRLAPGLDLIVCFLRTAAALRRRRAALESALAPAGSLWIAWPKRSSGVATDLSENLLREVFLPAGLVDNKVCAIDETWSGLRFVVRLTERAAWPTTGSRPPARSS